jgi:alpha-beta hydrolase superfamily lysophospholipase
LQQRGSKRKEEHLKKEAKRSAATFNPNSATKVDLANANRGPLLLIAGAEDNTAPLVIVKSTLKAYRRSPAVTELKEFAGRSHSLTIDSGWQELAEYCLAWLRAKGLGLSEAAPNRAAQPVFAPESNPV